MGEKRNRCPPRSKLVARRQDLNVPEHSTEVKAGASPGGPGRTVAGEPLDSGPLEAVQVNVGNEFAAYPVNAGGPSVVAAPEHAVVLSLLSPSSERRQTEVRKDDPSCITREGLHYLWHRCAVTNVFVDEELGLEPPTSERSEVRRVQKILQVGDELAHQRFKAYLDSLAVWLVPPDLPG